MQPTPAPSSPPASPPAVAAEDHPVSYPEPPQNRGSAPFHVLAALFDRLQNERKPDKRRKLLASWFSHWRKEVGPNLYPVLRLIIPQKDRERAVYGLKEKNLAKAYIKLIGLGRHDPDAIRLLNWKKPTDREKTSGDFPTVLYEVVNKRSSIVEGSLSIDEVNDYLDELSQNMGKSDKQSHVLRRIYNQTTPDEQRWLVRIILKDMIISVKENTVFGVFHPDAYDLFNTCSDLKKVAWELWNPNRRLNDEDKAVQLFRAFAPMLCKRPTKKIEDSVREMGGRPFIIEEKLDGERMQLHKRGSEYFYCSRKGKDYTYLYGKHVGTGSLTPYIDAAFDDRVDEIILDGEMLVWDPVSERNLPFGTLKTAALDKSKKEYSPRPCFKVFDLLYLNGMSLLHKSTKFRKRNLRSCLKEVPGRIEFITEYEGKTAKDVRRRMEDIVANRGEGLILKHPDAEYVLNGRNKDWIKVKPEYMDNMGETVDVIVVGGNYGTGRRSGGVSTLICAVLDDRRVNEDEDPKYSTFVRIGSGLSYADYIWIRQKPWKPLGPNMPDFLQCSRKGHEDKGDVYLEPEDSFILKVKAAEIVSSELYHLGFTMRFPRALYIRDDLSIADCMTASAVLESIRSDKKRKMDDDDDKPKKKTKKTAKKPTIMPEYQGTNLKDVPVESDLFKDYKFMVSSDPKSRTGAEDKKALLQMIHAHGGKYVQFARNDPKLLVVYGGQTTPYDLKLIMNKDTCDIIRPQWILDCVAEGEIVPLTKKYFFHATTARKETDEYNAEDSDTEEEPEEPEVSIPAASTSKGKSETPEEERAAPRDKDEETPIDPSMAEWFDVGKARSAASSTLASETESETEPEPDEPEPDSDNEDNRREDVEAGFDDDDWEQIEKEGLQSQQSSGKGKVKDEDGDVRMGEDDDAMHYDEEHIFKHLCFYLDSPSNARKHGMSIKAKNEADIEKRFTAIEKLIKDNGGRIADLDEPKLTHVVLDKRDISRRQELIKRTSKPKRRHLVIAEFIEVCIEEGTLLAEEEFMP
ncbi:DNA ligase 4 [Lentinus tigrinus ALCF2SS1-7]|uniref:DNA ligase n=1 Tax=Lentinus tigrinus ALCF2SS1-6 TaxID=1328759 RepID=A0A5C2SLB9_9APHY|nr:DNA ligase 4 [Lentinus tigrinus ALCF2SS1-6]RPD76640.1 DNA ligase 4 [Lentinus tigrinus ALCF2SS1-7]